MIKKLNADGDVGTALSVRVNGEDDVRFDMMYDKGMFVQNMLYTPITNDPVDLGFKHVEAEAEVEVE